MNAHWKRRAMTLLIVPLLAGCGSGAPTTTPRAIPTQIPRMTSAASPARPTATAVQPATPTPQGSVNIVDTSVAAASNSFGFDLLHELQGGAQGENLFISPLSLALLLQMAYNGADGQTAQEIAQVLQVEGMDIAALNTASKTLQDELAATADVEVLLGNSVWVQQGHTLLASFLDTAAAFFNAEAATLDFASPAAVERINSWVAEKSNGKIDKLFDQLDANVVTYLINTVYFKGAWAKPFDPAQTQPQPFYLADGSEITVPMMAQEGDFAFTAGDDFTALALPYGTGDVRMVVVLPNEGVALDSVVGAMTPEVWTETLAQLAGETRVMVTLPRFRLEYDATLNDALMALGMESAFSQPDFANLVEGGGVSLSYVRHKAVVEVNEEGTEAAAVSVGATTLSMPPSFTVNRPFFFAIHDAATDTILFMGAVYQPEAVE